MPQQLFMRSCFIRLFWSLFRHTSSLAVYISYFFHDLYSKKENPKSLLLPSYRSFSTETTHFEPAFDGGVDSIIAFNYRSENVSLVCILNVSHRMHAIYAVRRRKFKCHTIIVVVRFFDAFSRLTCPVMSMGMQRVYSNCNVVDFSLCA